MSGENRAVKEFGEVFTPHNIVVDMCNLPGAKEVINDLDKTILEPTCGDGAFLTEIIRRRLRMAQKCENVELGIYKALAGVYGVDIQEKNVKASINNIINVFSEDEFLGINSIVNNVTVMSNIKSILKYNIIVGDTLEKGSCVELYDWKFSTDGSVHGKPDSFQVPYICSNIREFTCDNYRSLHEAIEMANKYKEENTYEI